MVLVLQKYFTVVTGIVRYPFHSLIIAGTPLSLAGDHPLRLAGIPVNTQRVGRGRDTT